MTLGGPIISEDFAIKVHRDATVLCGEITGYFYREKIRINEAIFVPMIIFARIVRLRDATLILTKAGHPTEAGIIVLSQFEAKLDLARAAREVKWASRWVEHRNPRQSVTQNVTDAIRAVFADQDSADEQSIFRHLSALKHGNPASSELGFQVRRTNGTIMVSTGEIEDASTEAASAMIGGYATCQLAWAAQELNATICRYAKCEPATILAVRDNWAKLSGFRKEFASFLASLVEDRAGHLDLASMKRRT
jgi:hypothetical protein